MHLIIFQPYSPALTYSTVWSHLLNVIFMLNCRLAQPCTRPLHAPQSHDAGKAKENIWYHCLHCLTDTDTRAFTVQHWSHEYGHDSGRKKEVVRLMRHSTYHNTAHLHYSLKTSKYSQKTGIYVRLALCLFTPPTHPQPYCSPPASRG